MKNSPLPRPAQAAPAPTNFKGANGFDLMHGAAIKADIIPKTQTPRHLIPKTGLRLGLSGGSPS